MKKEYQVVDYRLNSSIFVFLAESVRVRVCMVSTFSRAYISPVVAIPARGQLSSFIPSLRSRLRIWPRVTRSAVPSRTGPLIFNTQAESGGYSRDSSRFPQPPRPYNLPSIAIRSFLS